METLELSCVQSRSTKKSLPFFMRGLKQQALTAQPPLHKVRGTKFCGCGDHLVFVCRHVCSRFRCALCVFSPSLCSSYPSAKCVVEFFQTQDCSEIAENSTARPIRCQVILALDRLSRFAKKNPARLKKRSSKKGKVRPHLLLCL